MLLEKHWVNHINTLNTACTAFSLCWCWMPVKKTYSFWWCNFFLNVYLSLLCRVWWWLTAAWGTASVARSCQPPWQRWESWRLWSWTLTSPTRLSRTGASRSITRSFLHEPFWNILLMSVALFPGRKSVLGKLTSSSMEKSCFVERTASHFTSVFSTQVHKTKHPKTQEHLLEHVQYALFMCVQSHVKRRRLPRCQKD